MDVSEIGRILFFTLPFGVETGNSISYQRRVLVGPLRPFISVIASASAPRPPSAATLHKFRTKESGGIVERCELRCSDSETANRVITVPFFGRVTLSEEAPNVFRARFGKGWPGVDEAEVAGSSRGEILFDRDSGAARKLPERLNPRHGGEISVPGGGRRNLLPSRGGISPRHINILPSVYFRRYPRPWKRNRRN